jgi:hypothetical protein
LILHVPVCGIFHDKFSSFFEGTGTPFRVGRMNFASVLSDGRPGRGSEDIGTQADNTDTELTASMADTRSTGAGKRANNNIEVTGRMQDRVESHLFEWRACEAAQQLRGPSAPAGARHGAQ